MPNTNIHERVAYVISKKYDLYSRDFFLGNMTPDSVNVDGFAEKEVRWSAHLRKKDLDEWKDNVIDFYKNNINDYNKDFLIGYITHIITDIMHDKYMYNKQIKRILEKNKCTNQEAHEILRLDMEKYRFPEWEEISSLLKSDDIYYDISNIDKNTLKRWCINQANNYYDNEKSLYQTEEDMIELTNYVENELKYIYECI